jgi:hypothetical protein
MGDSTECAPIAARKSLQRRQPIASSIEWDLSFAMSGGRHRRYGGRHCPRLCDCARSNPQCAIFGAPIEALDSGSPQRSRTEMANVTTRALKLATHWVLGAPAVSRRGCKCWLPLRPSLTALAALAPDLMIGGISERIQSIRDRLVSNGVPELLAVGLAELWSYCRAQLTLPNCRKSSKSPWRRPHVSIYRLSAEFGFRMNSGWRSAPWPRRVTGDRLPGLPCARICCDFTGR